ncbi:hypothetical protein [Paraburkholderia sp. D1E]|uniref:hypothetical protein n=1 Tax=Paraburkholderia sp. D1E TaxID=3461398 RepID=UPI004045A6A1
MNISALIVPTTTLEVSPSFWHPDADTPIMAAEESVRSLFGHGVWNLSALRGNSNWTKTVDFSTVTKLGVADRTSLLQLKTLLYLMLHKEGEELPAENTFRGKYYAARAFAIEASTAGLTLYEAINDVEFGLMFIKKKPSSAVEFYGMLASFVHIPEKLDVSIPLKALHSTIVKADRHLRDTEKQTPVIPSRIYSGILSALAAELDIVESILDDLIAFIKTVHTGAGQIAPEASERLKVYARHCGLWEDLTTPTQLAGAISNVYAVCGANIHAYTGMRRSEVEFLPFNSLSVFRHGGKDHHCVVGFTTKFNKGKRKRAQWITNATGARAVRCAMRLARELHSINGNADSLDENGLELLLFPRHGFGSYGEYSALQSQAAPNQKNKLFERISPLIQAADIEELAKIDVDRNWDGEEDFRVGQRWPLTTHQFRRSLAIYAHRSGLVTLPTLKAQLQHLTQEMSMYYSKGSIFAKSILSSKSHFGNEWNAGKSLSEYLGYALNVLMSDERLFGGAAAWANSTAVKFSPVSVYSRGHAIKMFEKGEIAYRETVLGGCTSTESCDSPPINPIPLECLEKNCRNLVASPRKIKKVLESQEIIVERLREQSPLSVEHRIETKGLEILRNVLNKIDERG